MIQTSYRDDRGEVVELSPNDAKYWEGPYVFIPYPKALYRVTQPGQDAEKAEHRIVRSDSEHRALGSGWFESPYEAKEAFNRLEADVAKAAAESNYADRNLSAAAKAERLAHERSTDEMVTTVPEKRRPGRPKKVEGVE